MKEVFNYKITPDNSTIEMIDLGEALGGMREATAEIVGNSLVSYLKVPSGEIDMIATRSMNPSKYFTMYYTVNQPPHWALRQYGHPGGIQGWLGVERYQLCKRDTSRSTK